MIKTKQVFLKFKLNKPNQVYFQVILKQIYLVQFNPLMDLYLAQLALYLVQIYLYLVQLKKDKQRVKKIFKDKTQKI